MRFAYAARSHVGQVRAVNEDSGFAHPNLMLVADGVGGGPAGEVASASATFVLAAMSMKESGPLTPSEPDVLLGLSESLERAYRHLRDGVARAPERAGMATTLTAVHTNGHQVGLAQLGDSRAYLLRDGRLTQLSTDHTFVRALVEDGKITSEQAVAHPFRSAVLRYLGGEERHEPDLTLLDVHEGDRLLLCTDGLTDFVAEEHIAGLLGIRSRHAVVQALISAALESGGRDNITCVVGDLTAGDVRTWSRRYTDFCGAAGDLRNLIDPVGGIRAG